MKREIYTVFTPYHSPFVHEELTKYIASLPGYCGVKPMGENGALWMFEQLSLAKDAHRKISAAETDPSIFLYKYRRDRGGDIDPRKVEAVYMAERRKKDTAPAMAQGGEQVAFLSANA